MTLILLKEHVDIYTFPSVDTLHRSDTSTQLTIGDLHGNAIKLLYFLLKQGIVKNITQEDYAKLIYVYKKPVYLLEKNDLTLFQKILEKIQGNQRGVVRLLGDELADRGSNDYFTLKLLEKLHEQSVCVEILLSNHGIEFIEAYEKETFIPPRLHHLFSISMMKLERLIDIDLVARDEVIDIYTRAYKPSLKVISYSLSEDKKSQMLLYSHAPIGLDTVKNLASKFKILYKSKTAIQLARTIDRINSAFQKFVTNNTVHTLFNWGSQDDPFECLTWNRAYAALDRPVEKAGFALTFVHGHDSNEPSKHNIINLDNQLGKGEAANQGEYTVLYSHQARFLTVKKISPYTEQEGIVRKKIDFCPARRASPFSFFPNKALSNTCQASVLALENRNELSSKKVGNRVTNYTLVNSMLVAVFFGFLAWRLIFLVRKVLSYLGNRGQNLLLTGDDKASVNMNSQRPELSLVVAPPSLFKERKPAQEPALENDRGLMQQRPN